MDADDAQPTIDFETRPEMVFAAVELAKPEWASVSYGVTAQNGGAQGRQKGTSLETIQATLRKARRELWQVRVSHEPDASDGGLRWQVSVEKPPASKYGRESTVVFGLSTPEMPEVEALAQTIRLPPLPPNQDD